MSGKRAEIFDRIRKKYVSLTPEEWVRQHFVSYLIEEKKYPASLIKIEGGLSYNQLKKRSDIVVYNNKAEVVIIVECKLPEINITQDTFDQIAIYNMKYKSKYLVVTNGLMHYCCCMDYSAKTYNFIPELPQNADS